MFFPSIFVFITISHLIAPPTRLLVLCHPFGTFFVRVCGVTSFSSVFIVMDFVGDRTWPPCQSEELLFGAFWIIRMPSMVFDVIL